MIVRAPLPLLALLLAASAPRPAVAEPPPDPAAQLAPSLAELREALAGADATVGDAEARLGSVAAAQNAWAEAVLLPAGNLPCADEAALAPARAAAAGGADLRAAAQAARVDADRAAWMLEQPTVAPLVSGPERAQAAELLRRAAAVAAAYEATAAWERKHVAPALTRCASAAARTAAAAPAGAPPTPPKTQAGPTSGPSTTQAETAPPPDPTPAAAVEPAAAATPAPPPADASPPAEAPTPAEPPADGPAEG